MKTTWKMTQDQWKDLTWITAVRKSNLKQLHKSNTATGGHRSNGIRRRTFASSDVCDANLLNLQSMVKKQGVHVRLVEVTGYAWVSFYFNEVDG